MFIKIILVLMFVLNPSSHARSTKVKGYTKKSGRYVNTYRRTAPNRKKAIIGHTKAISIPTPAKKVEKSDC